VYRIGIRAGVTIAKIPDKGKGVGAGVGKFKSFTITPDEAGKAELKTGIDDSGADGIPLAAAKLVGDINKNQSFAGGFYVVGEKTI